ncbi:MAG TPA: hypothetical protein VG322_00530 [Candidatus Acidoferrales bacterium]|jgi:hypothetical protein|nr:hypothetical protein [Candidatus Acidoferrales bacterium]
MAMIVAVSRALLRNKFAIRPISSAVLLCVLVLCGCHHEIAVDTAPLDSAGMNYDAIKQLKSANISTAEVAEVAKARQGGLPDSACIAVFQVYRSRKQRFDVGDAAAGLIGAGISPTTVVALAGLNQLGPESGELLAMRLAGIPDETILEVARHHAQGHPVLSGAALARMKNAGMRDATLLELARRGVPDSESANIVTLRHHGFNDAEILRHFTGS